MTEATGQCPPPNRLQALGQALCTQFQPHKPTNCSAVKFTLHVREPKLRLLCPAGVIR